MKPLTRAEVENWLEYSAAGKDLRARVLALVDDRDAAIARAEAAERERDELNRESASALHERCNDMDALEKVGEAAKAIAQQRDAARAEVDVWKKEHAKAHGDWLETRKKASEALAEVSRLTAAVAMLRDALHDLRVSHQILDDCHSNDSLRRETTGPADDKAWAALAQTADAERWLENIRRDAASAMRSLILSAPEVELKEWLEKRDARIRSESAARVARLEEALREISTLIVDHDASPTFTASNLAEAVSSARAALKGEP